MALLGHYILESLDVNLGTSTADIDSLVAIALRPSEAAMSKSSSTDYMAVLCGLQTDPWAGSPALKRYFLPEDVAFQKTHM